MIEYECYNTGIIVERIRNFPSQFSIVRKYDVAYKEELPRFRKSPLHIYGLPFFDEPEHVYLGLDRRGPSIFELRKAVFNDNQKTLREKIEKGVFFNEPIIDETDANAYLNSLQSKAVYELVWAKNSGSIEKAPSGYGFLGFDITYAPEYDGAFSIICDCMFICKWHGCDAEGTLFAEDFAKLNKNGLFHDCQSAYDYMVKYLNEDWSESGNYGIFEIYGKEKEIVTQP
ncbi:MAG: hypothetical protein GX802_08350 [Clostridiales bacterium]|nr:hypothetical protein [Clostridiales bacterium]